jgi:hypothetical protein
MMFDAPDSNVSCPRRERSTTPLQALNLLNDPVFFEAAQALAVRVWRESQPSRPGRIDYVYRLCLGRPPEQRERDRMLQFLQEQQRRFAGDAQLTASMYAGKVEGVAPEDLAAWIALSRSLLNTDEFLTRE